MLMEYRLKATKKLHYTKTLLHALLSKKHAEIMINGIQKRKHFARTSKRAETGQMSGETYTHTQLGICMQITCIRLWQVTVMLINYVNNFHLINYYTPVWFNTSECEQKKKNTHTHTLVD